MNYKKISVWFIVVGVLVISIVYGISFFSDFFYSHEHQLAKDIFQKQMERELAEGPNKKLADLHAKAEIRHLTATEEDEVVAKNKEAEDIRKKYESKLMPLPAKPASLKPKEEVWDWTFEWEATAEQLASGRQKIVGRINEAKILSYTSKVLKFRYKRPSGKIVNLTLDRDDPEKEFYFGRVSQSDLYLRVWLLPDEKGNFKGQFDNGPGKISMEVFLKKKL